MKRLLQHNSKDFCKLWSSHYYNKVGSNYLINWQKDGNTFKKLLSSIPPRLLRKLVKFAFSEHPSTLYLRTSGYSISVLPTQINTFQSAMQSPELHIPKQELDLDVPYWNDSRTSYLWSCIVSGDLNSLIDNIETDYCWLILLNKLTEQKGWIPKKVSIFYERWKLKEDFSRSRIIRKP